MADFMMGNIALKGNLNQAKTGTVGNASEQVIDPNPDRSSLIVRNTHASNNLFLEFSQDATTSSPIKLAPDDIFICENDIPYQGSLNLIADGASTNYSVSEYNKDTDL